MSSIARIYTLICLLIYLLTTIAFFDGINQLDKLKETYFEASEENEWTSLLSFINKRSVDRHKLNASLENVENKFRKKADTLSRILKTHIDLLRNETDEVILFNRTFHNKFIKLLSL